MVLGLLKRDFMVRWSLIHRAEISCYNCTLLWGILVLLKHRASSNCVCYKGAWWPLTCRDETHNYTKWILKCPLLLKHPKLQLFGLHCKEQFEARWPLTHRAKTSPILIQKAFNLAETPRAVASGSLLILGACYKENSWAVGGKMTFDP